MRRVPIRPRSNLAERAEELGFAFASIDGEPYWDESAYYSFTLKEIEEDLEAPTNALAALCLELVDKIVGDEEALRRLQIPDNAWDQIAASWKREDPTLYGRFDFSYSGEGPAKLLEYNADTPTALYEAAVFQWAWLEDGLKSGALPKGADQFNSLHEKLIARLKAVGEGGLFHIASMQGDAEDDGFVAYLKECAVQAGLQVEVLGMADIGLSSDGRFTDLKDRWIELLFKLYPWEWMWADAFGASAAMGKTTFIEPQWKAILSNKGMLPLLWKMAPNHPNLLPAFFDDDPQKAELGGRFARKPLFSREGSNVLIVDGDTVVDRDEGPYGKEGFIRQGLALLPDFDGMRPVMGSWVIDDEACGLGVREDKSAITKNTSRFVPHAIVG